MIGSVCARLRCRRRRAVERSASADSPIPPNIGALLAAYPNAELKFPVGSHSIASHVGTIEVIVAFAGRLAGAANHSTASASKN
jgi:hypothetical protein